MKSRAVSAMRYANQYALALLLLMAVQAKATTIEELSFARLVADSTLIFVGTVVGQQDQSPVVDGALVDTALNFHVDSVIKGQVSGASITLHFVGGKPNASGTEVEGQFIPTLGAKGVFFVSTLADKQINPLTGWQQGFFPLTADTSGQLFLDMWQRPDFKVPGLLVDPLASKMRALGFSQQAIDEKIPRAWLFSLKDFVDGIKHEMTQVTSP